MKVVYINTGSIHSFVRHWFYWYILTEGGGLLKIEKKWFKEARKNGQTRPN